MNFAIILRDGRHEYALDKTDSLARAEYLEALCKAHLYKVRPETHTSLSVNRATNIDVEMHPDKKSIMLGLLLAEFPLPAEEDILEGDYCVL